LVSAGEDGARSRQAPLRCSSRHEAAEGGALPMPVTDAGALGNYAPLAET
jgi:hypothetical protein